jgi:hydroxymethylglutaryl-CoA lyase
MADRVTICEVSPRDGLQNETASVSTADKIRLVDLLSATGLSYIEAVSFVSPRAVPAMADAAEVMAGITRRPGVTYAALAPNIKGYTAALAAQVDEVAVFASASESFSRRNLNCSIEESLARYQGVCDAARGDGMPVRGYVSCIAACPYEGRVDPARVLEVTGALFDMGCREVSLGDTIGAASVEQLDRLLRLLTQSFPPERLAGHFHDTRGAALGLIRLSLSHGLRVFDASVAGAGGCPYAPGAPGNVATESVCRLLNQEGYETGIDLPALEAAASFLRKLLGRPA